MIPLGVVIKYMYGELCRDMIKYFNNITYRRGTAVPESVYITRIGNPIIIVKGASLFHAFLVVRAVYIILIYYSLTVSLITRESWQPCGGKVLLLPDMREIFI